MTKDSENNHHFCEHLILRDLELFNRASGIGFFSPELLKKYNHLIPISPEPRVIWLPRETQYLQTKIKNHKSVIIQGELGSGKSALIYGLRAQNRESCLPYCYIDGHFTSTPEEKIASALRWSIKNKATVYWDSLDYLIVGSKKHRRLPMNEHLERSHILLEMLVDFIDNQTNALVATTHNSSWLNRFADPVLINKTWPKLLKKMNKHEVRGVFETDNEIRQFYLHAGFTVSEVKYITGLKKNSLLLNILKRIPNKSAEIIFALNQYKIAKLFALDKSELAEDLRLSLKELFIGNLSEEAFLFKLINFIIEMNIKTQRLGGNL